MRRLVLMATLVIPMLVGAPLIAQAATQDPPPAASDAGDDLAELRAIFPGLMDQLNALAETMGIEALPPVDWDRFLSDFADAMPRLPEDDERSWSSGAHFEFNTQTATNGVLEDDETPRPVLGDAASCLSNGQTGEILHFRRIRTKDLRGHHCVIGLDEDQGMWLLDSITVVEGHGRRLVSEYRLAAVVEDDPVQTRAMVEPKIEAQIAVASSIADYAMGLMDRAPAATPEP